MELIAWVLGKESISLEQEFSRYRKERLPSNITTISVDKTGHATLRDKPFSPSKEYEMLGKYYEANKEKIQKVLASKTPSYC
jgi:hypothetical protein